MSYYDPHRVFNHRRTAEQRKGQSIQNKLIDPIEPRVDPEVLRKAKRLCEVYNLIPQPRLPLQIKLENITVENQTFLNSYIHQYLNSINAPDSKYLVTVATNGGIPFDNPTTTGITRHAYQLSYMIIQHNTATYDEPIEGHYFANEMTYSSMTSTSTLDSQTFKDIHASLNYFNLWPSKLSKEYGNAAQISDAVYTILIFEIIE